MTTGIYAITNTVTDKRYIGLSRNIEARWAWHVEILEDGRASIKLQSAWNTFDRDVWEWSILVVCEDTALSQYEIALIALYDACHNGYNSTLGGERGWINLGLAQHGDANPMRRPELCGDNHPMRSDPERARQHAEAMRGKKHSEETRERMSDTWLAKGATHHIHRPGAKEKALQVLSSPEVVERMRITKRSPEGRAKVSGANNPCSLSCEFEDAQYGSVAEAERAVGHTRCWMKRRGLIIFREEQ